ncbi:MAG: 1-acyl-sn-glycerol-3-phosphate acyltransferase [Actinobacteria bacterium]|nr:1-acyl-sn-glycerol-3-phosphate acyltransferase [Actinomycetota bacterium]
MPPPLYRFLRTIGWPIVHGLFRLEVTGLEHVPRQGGCVLAASHISNFDPWPLGSPLYPRYLRFMAKSELYWWPLRYVLDAAGAFPVRRGEGDREALERAVSLCRQGELVVMFPEGTRRKKGLRKKWQPRAHTGAARIALEAGVPLIPAGITGTERLARLGPFRVAYGPPMPLVNPGNEDVKDAAQIVTEQLMAEIHRLERSLE